MSVQNEKKLPLEGVRVIEFVHMVMGPTCGLLLADLGAEVIKIEPAPRGDNTRRLTGSGAGYWMTYNRNKKSLAIDVKSVEGLEVVKKLIATADVFTENFRPGAMEKIGLGYEAVKAIKPDIIYSSMKGFLPGPYENRTALDEVVQMMTGLAYMTGPEGRPLRAGASVNDVMGGMFSAITILAALLQRGQSGKGQFVQTGLYENSAFLVAQHMMQKAVTGKSAAPMPSRLSAWAVYDVFTTCENEQVFIGVVSDTQWKVFCEAFGMHDFAVDEGLTTNTQRVQARDRIMPVIREHVLTMPKQDVMALCEQFGLPFSPIRRPDDLFEDIHLNESGGMTGVTLPDGTEVSIPMLPFEMDGQRFGTRINVPEVGRDSASILEELGYTSDAIERLEERGVISSPI
ncbi:CaiB/BaiF CoA transferase family protein [Enterobacter hormaechei]|uniref:CaiB/BaiF CoA transferase family protein n=1 Tax=Enterobacter cloacae complex TaxID=354276 RepID=UPI0007944E7F|nr:CaiB/BaiF CoA-transferase family protein [Enterobacter hormaechei]MDO2398862.1 CaiB/BaiF CoA-transferase family protein [Enterobacter hormaechei]MDO2404136.1 CaiB/BaiF CoA-transferase family protein [Enterobacter hormaechei]MDO2418598.1 CaiB/BaiF CoA-transferase family protein [Enterobacter hormaechei]MDO2426277.1 CaiB/BaiF CoA-transferase family protein [Enterobacter hormaechei]CZY23777.1 L-carnitine dehydratase/bile acid-inducible protein F [Enterobacter hormaechei]